MVMLELGNGCIAICTIVMFTVPMGLPFRRAFLEDLAAAFGTQNVVAEAEVFVKHESAFWDPFLASAALDFVWICGYRPLVIGGAAIGLRVRIEG
jgi:hypothetical protein